MLLLLGVSLSFVNFAFIHRLCVGSRSSGLGSWAQATNKNIYIYVSILTVRINLPKLKMEQILKKLTVIMVSNAQNSTLIVHLLSNNL